MNALPQHHNLFDQIPDNLPDELVQILSHSDGVRIERIVSQGQCSASGFWYDQETDEFVALLKGSAGLRFKGSEDVLVMAPGDYVNIPAHVQHQVAWTDPAGDTVWLAIHYS